MFIPVVLLISFAAFLPVLPFNYSHQTINEESVLYIEA